MVRDCPNGCEVIRRTNSAPRLQGLRAAMLVRRRSGLVNVSFQLSDDDGK